MGEIIPRPTPPIPLPFTGERLTSDYQGQTEIEHLHRYLVAREYCRGKDVLDVASGEGYGAALIGQVANTVTGLEIAPEVVDHATQAYARNGVRFMQGDARAMPILAELFDVVVSFETIEHIAEQEDFLDEVRRVLRPGGLLIVSTPDRDNYSPAETSANPYHVRELTAAEFERLLRSRFAEVSISLQRPVFGSVLMPTDAGAGVPMCFERRGQEHFEASPGLARPQYLLAFASDAAAAVRSPSVYIETSRLGLLSPQETEARLAALQEALTAERARSAGEAADRLRSEADAQARSEAAELERLRDQAEAQARMAEQQAALAKLQQLQDGLSQDVQDARGEIRGLVASNEMAERACATLSGELASLQLLSSSEHERLRWTCGEAEALARRLEADLVHVRNLLAHSDELLAATRASHSWRITAPVRRLSRILYRRE